MLKGFARTRGQVFVVRTPAELSIPTKNTDRLTKYHIVLGI